MYLIKVRDIPSFGAFFYTYEILLGGPNLLGYNGNYGVESTDQLKQLGKIIVSHISLSHFCYFLVPTGTLLQKLRT